MNAAARRLWGWPIALGLLTASGLLSALVSDAWGDAWAWLALGLPLLVAACCVVMPAPRSASQPARGER
jgi:hypothetical protein